MPQTDLLPSYYSPFPASCHLMSHKSPLSTQGDKLDLLPATSRPSSSSIPYLVRVRSLAQSQHLLQGLGYHRLPLVQELLLTITEVKAKAQVQVPRAASEGQGGGLGDYSVEGNLSPAPFSQGQTPLCGLSTEMGRERNLHGSRQRELVGAECTSSPTPRDWNPTSPHFCLHTQSHLLVLKERAAPFLACRAGSFKGNCLLPMAPTALHLWPDG